MTQRDKNWSIPPPSQDSLEDDFRLITMLLEGYTEVDDGGLEYYDYFEQQDENEARRALAKLLRGRKWPDIGDGLLSQEALLGAACEMLATLIDPDPDNNPRTAHERKITFGFRRKGRRSKDFTNSQIIHLVQIRRRKGNTIEDAAAWVHEHYKISESLVLKLWARRHEIARSFGETWDDSLGTTNNRRPRPR